MKIGVLGAGTMGSGIAQVFAKLPENEVFLCDITKEFAEGGKEKIKKSLLKLVEKGKMDQKSADDMLSRIKTGLKDICSDCDLIVEAAVENMEIKKQTFKELDTICKKENCIFASNTSSLSITEIGHGLKHDMIGMHFFNPAPVMKLIEIIRGYNTKDETFNAIKDISIKIGKTPVEVKEAPGFVVNRILIPMINEAAFIYSEGIATVEDIDNAMMLGANHPMGPLALADLIGLDVCLAIMEVLFNENKDSKYRPCPLLRKMVRAGKLGRKTKAGFYNY